MKKLSYVEWYWQGENAEIRLRQVETYHCGYANVTVEGKDYLFRWQVGYSSVPDSGGLVLKLPYEEAADLPDCEEHKRGNEYRTRFDALYKDKAIRSDGKVLLFGVTYDSVVLEKRDLDRSTIKPMEYFDFDWNDENGNISFRSNFIDKCDGTAKSKNSNEINIRVVWYWDNKFEIYTPSNNGTEPELIAEGTYTNVEKTATLNFTTNNLFNFDTLEITATHRE